MKAIRLMALLLFAQVLCTGVAEVPQSPRLAQLPLVAIQPLGPVKASEISRVKEGITARYAVTVEVLPPRPLPETAWYEPRQRYKADDVIDAMVSLEPRFNKIVMLTSRDISVTNDEGKDWGIMGLGQLGGRLCLVSTFRLRKGEAGEKRFPARLIKVVNHELGHTFGLDHCEAPGCLMQDARGKIATMDAENGAPCANCSARLPLHPPGS